MLFLTLMRHAIFAPGLFALSQVLIFMNPPIPNSVELTPVLLLEDSWSCSLWIWICVFLYHPLRQLGMDNGGISFLLLLSSWWYIIFQSRTFLTTIIKTAVLSLSKPFITCSTFPFFHSTYRFLSYHKVLFFMLTMYYWLPWWLRR